MQDALAAYTEAQQALAAHPEAARYLAVRRAGLEIARADRSAGLRGLIPLAQITVPAAKPDPAAFQARQLLRSQSRSDPASAAQVIGLWRAATGMEPPPWLSLPEAALRLAAEWISCPTWAASRAFWNEHTEDLLSAETLSALEELTLIRTAAEEHLRIAREAMATDPDRAFRPYLTGELLHAWIDTSTWEESEAYLVEHATALLHDQALELLDSDLETTDSAVHFALATLARADEIPAAYGYVKDRPTLDDRLQQVMAVPEPDPELLRALGLLEWLVHQDEFTGAAHIALAATLGGGSVPPDTPWPPAEPADRDRVILEIAGFIGRYPEHAPALGALIQQILAAAQRPL